MLTFFSSRSVWDWFDIAGVFLVLIGVVGEIWIPRRKFTPFTTKKLEDFDESDPSLVEYEGAKKAWATRMTRWEHRAQNILVLGLALELVLKQACLDFLLLRSTSVRDYRDSYLQVVCSADRRFAPLTLKSMI